MPKPTAKPTPVKRSPPKRDRGATVSPTPALASSGGSESSGGGGGGLTRKQREIRDREQLILSAGRRILLAAGYTGLNMDKVAKAVEYSKGTVYQHFKSKEDLIAAIAAQTHAKRAAFFKRAAHWRAKSRERVTALGVADQILTTIDQEHAAIERVIDLDSLQDKVDITRKRTIDQAKQGVREAFELIIRDAVAEGDLVLTDPQQPERIHYGLATMAIGHAAASGGCLADHALDPEGLAAQRKHHTDMLWQNYHTWLDAQDWKPLQKDHDYAATARRAVEEVFPNEAPILATTPGPSSSRPPT